MTTPAVLMFDGGARPPDNEGAAIDFTLQIEAKPRREYSQRIVNATCNEAEYHALISGLRIALNGVVDEIPSLSRGKLRSLDALKHRFTGDAVSR